MALTSRKTVVIKRPTRLDQLVAKFNSVQQVKFYIEHIEGDFRDYESEHDRYYASLEALCRSVERVSRMHLIDWSQLPNYQFATDDLVATIGQDGLVANTLKYLGEQLVIGFNSDRGRWDGILAQFAPEDAASAIEQGMDEKLQVKRITKGMVELSDHQTLVAVNDFFVGVANHSSARYRIRHGESEEVHSSSGVIVSTPLGRSAWMRSILTGAGSLMNRIQHKKQRVVEAKKADQWDEDSLYFAVREPFPSVSSKTDVVFGRIRGPAEFMIESKMGEGGLIFSDGVQSDFLNFNYSVRARFGIASEKGRLAVLGG